jgi:hypothetical protein
VAQKVQVILVDDIDGGDAEETVLFALDGVSYEIDLSSKNAGKLRDSLAAYVGSARKSAGRGGARGRGRGRQARQSTSSVNTSEVRAWAKQHGYEVSERGRIPANIVAEFEKAGN